MFLCGECDDYYNNDNNNDDNEDDDDDHISTWLATCARKPKVPGSSPAATYSRVPNNRPPRLLTFRFFPTQDTFVPTPSIINFQSFFLTFFSVNSHFYHSPAKKKQIAQSSTITTNYVNTKHMLSLWDPIVGMSIE